jgi:hypothetical protein
MRLITLSTWRYCFFLCISINTSYSDENIAKEKYIASAITHELIKDAKAVVRYENQSLKVSSIRKANLNVHRIITILNAEGRQFGEVQLYYDKFRKIENLEGNIYNAQGEKIRPLEDKDINDYTATSDFSLYEDSRIQVASLFNGEYPYTVEFVYEIKYDGYIGFPSWFPQEDNASVEYSQFEVVFPANLPLRYWKNIPDSPQVSFQENNTIWKWQALSLRPFETEPVGPETIDQYQSVHIAPEKFEIDGYRGDLSSWKSFGDWFNKLYDNRQEIPDNLRQKIIEITKNIITDKEKIRILYQYLQSKTRYVSIQLGVGGWRPFDASYVCERGYGDCKALTNFMMSLLKVVSIKAYPALIYNSTKASNFLNDFPSNQFNHVILCIPTPPETLWLECTSQNIPFGHLGLNNEDRFCLLITPDGGIPVRTPASNSVSNRQQRITHVDLNFAGDATADIYTIYTGDQQDHVRTGLKDATAKERTDWLNENIHLPTFDLLNSDFAGLTRSSDTVSFKISIHLPRYAVSTNNRLIFQPNLMEKRFYVPRQIEKRNQPIVHSYPYLDTDTIIFNVSKYLSAEAIPKPVHIETNFAKFSSKITLTDSSTLLYTRYLEIFKKELPPEMYNDYRKFFQDVVQADKASVSFVKK